MASLVSDIASSYSTYNLHCILPPVMVHTSRSYQYTSYEEFRDNGMFSSEANCVPFLYNMKFLRIHQKCPSCKMPMTLTECSTSKYRDGCCWKCTCGRTAAPELEASYSRAASRMEAEESTERKKKAKRLLNSFAKLTAGGTALGDALKLRFIS